MPRKDKHEKENDRYGKQRMEKEIGSSKLLWEIKEKGSRNGFRTLKIEITGRCLQAKMDYRILWKMSGKRNTFLNIYW